VNIPSYQVNVGEEIAIKEKMHQNAMVLEARNVAQSQSWCVAGAGSEHFKAKVVACRSAKTCRPPINES